MQANSFHVGLAPYRDAYGNIRASYQELNAEGKAVTTVDMCDGSVVRIVSSEHSNTGALIRDALRHFYSTPSSHE